LPLEIAGLTPVPCGLDALRAGSGLGQKLFAKNDACVVAIALLRERVPQSAFGWQTGARTQVYPQ